VLARTDAKSDRQAEPNSPCPIVCATIDSWTGLEWTLDMVNANSNESSGSSRLRAWLSAIALWTAGSVIIAVGMGWIPIPPKENVPRWIVTLTGLTFAAAGFAPLATRLGRYTRVSHAAGIVVSASLAVIVNWVAFGPGPRQFSGGCRFSA
jgi:hypothetical protein